MSCSSPTRPVRDEALAEVAAEQGEIDLVRDQAAAAEKAAQASPTWWAQDLYSITTRPLAWMVPVLGILLVAGVIAVAVRVVRARRGPRGLVLSEVLRNGTGWRGGLVLLLLGAAAAAWTWAVWTALPDDASEPGFGSAVGAALTSTGVLALIALTRILPVDPRRWRDNVGGGLERLRGVVDRATTWPPTCAWTPRTATACARASSAGTARCCDAWRASTTRSSSSPTARARSSPSPPCSGTRGGDTGRPPAACGACAPGPRPSGARPWPGGCAAS